MNYNTVYFSPTHTTKRVVEAIGVEMGTCKHHDITLPEQRSKTLSFDTEDVVIFGLPVYSGRIPAFIEDYFRSIQGNQTRCVIVVVYGNRDYEDALLELKDIVIQNGFVPVAAAAFIGEHSFTDEVAKNRPDADDIRECRAFANSIDFDAVGILTVNGKYPYKERKASSPMALAMGPEINDQCQKCGLCVEECPAGALALNGHIMVDKSLCIKCHNCVKTCPFEAITYDDRIVPIRDWLIENFKESKAPEFFYMRG
jgi:ferredoxin